jgi:hypothetical protein
MYTQQTLLFVLQSLLGNFNVFGVKFDSKEVLAVLQGGDSGSGCASKWVQDSTGNGITCVTGTGGLPADRLKWIGVQPVLVFLPYFSVNPRFASTEPIQGATIYLGWLGTLKHSLPWRPTFGAATLLAGAGFYTGESQFHRHGCEMSTAKRFWVYNPHISLVTPCRITLLNWLIANFV